MLLLKPANWIKFELFYSLLFEVSDPVKIIGKKTSLGKAKLVLNLDLIC